MDKDLRSTREQIQEQRQPLRLSQGQVPVLSASNRKRSPGSSLFREMQITVTSHLLGWLPGKTDSLTCRHPNNEETFNIVHL